MTAVKGNAEIVKLLLAQGAEIEAQDNDGETALMYALKRGATQCVRALLQAGAEFSLGCNETRAELLGLDAYGEIDCSREEYLVGKTLRYGTANPEKMKVPFWNAMVRSGATEYLARKQFGELDVKPDKPVWCYWRYQKSAALLPDGRIIEIGGCHENWHDHYFTPYNDVIVHDGKGNFEIYGYPEELFPPIEEPSTVLVGAYLYIIGNGQLPDNMAYDKTPIYRLDCQTMAIEQVETSGENPGWISGHKAVYHSHVSSSGVIHVMNGSVYQPHKVKMKWEKNEFLFILDLNTLHWRREKA